ncbi:MAG TPA: hypothetical protein VFX96_05965 [Pyrinomonadaceae bacterium]|nr:hypothetical protein [Pyrinomonadaceae bacterium]
MSRHQFRLLVVVNLLLLFGNHFVHDATLGLLPPELQDYAGGGPSLLEAQWPYYFMLGLDFLTVAAAVGLCLGRRWGRTLYLACFVVSISATLMSPFHFSTAWSSLVGALFGTTEGMILALAYFSHLRRMFERRGRPDDAQDDEQDVESDGERAESI